MKLQEISDTEPLTPLHYLAERSDGLTFMQCLAVSAGFHAVAGPYDVNSPSDRVRQRDTGYCESSLADQLKVCPHARRVDHYGKVWIIRKLPLELDNGRRNKQNVAGNFGICAGRMAGV